MPKRPDLVLHGQTYPSQKLLVDALIASAREARKCFKPGRFTAAGWKRIDPEAFAKAVELGMSRSIARTSNQGT